MKTQTINIELDGTVSDPRAVVRAIRDAGVPYQEIRVRGFVGRDRVHDVGHTVINPEGGEE